MVFWGLWSCYWGVCENRGDPKIDPPNSRINPYNQDPRNVCAPKIVSRPNVLGVRFRLGMSPL